MKRRSFLKHSGAISLPILVNGLELDIMPRPSHMNGMSTNDRVLVLIQLGGGNDGLNTVLPIDQYSTLANFRPQILIPENKGLSLAANLKLHPSMGGMKNLFDNGQLNIIQSVGYPEQDRSHFRSTDIWTSGSPSDEHWTTGWLGRYFQYEIPDYPYSYPNASYPDPFALTIGRFVSETCQGLVSNFSLALDPPIESYQSSTAGFDTAPTSNYGLELEFIRDTILKSNAYNQRIVDTAQAGNNTVTYPDNVLAPQLMSVAQLISGGLETKVYICQLDGFDTHGDQVDLSDPLAGNHANLLSTLSETIEAFQNDLNNLGYAEKVMGLTFSEFGRQIYGNFSYGTDHGDAAPMFLFGNCVQPGIIGDNPTIDAQIDYETGVEMQFDFRNVYGSILVDWFGIGEGVVKDLLYDDFVKMPIINSSCLVDTHDITVPEQPDLRLFPNPANEYTNVSFEHLENGRVSIFVIPHSGQQEHLVFEKYLPQGEQAIQVPLTDFPAGSHTLLVRAGKSVLRKTVIRVR